MWTIMTQDTLTRLLTMVDFDYLVSCLDVLQKRRCLRHKRVACRAEANSQAELPLTGLNEHIQSLGH